MPVHQTLTEAATAGTSPLAIARFFRVTGSGNPAYLVVTAFDRDAYAAGASGAVGAFLGDGARLSLAPTIGNAREAAIVFAWTGTGYVNATYGAFYALQYVPSSSAGDVTNISVFTTSSLSLATRDAANPLAFAQADPSGNAGSATIVTGAQAQASGTATPDGIAAVAQGLVGHAWNDEGCWNLASTIAAEAGAGLPITATALGVAGHGSGEWVVVYDGPAHASADWRSLVCTGEVITFGTPGGGGHITTCVSGSGAGAMLIDNVVYANALGQIVNAAGDGSASDVLIAPAHSAAQEWAGVAADSVVIYALDTPVVTARAAPPALAPLATAPLSAFAAIGDPGGRAITQVQVYDPDQAVTLLVGGIAVRATSPARAISVTGLASITVEAGSVADTLEVRASNGLYWGDWQSIVIGSAPAAADMMQAAAATGSAGSFVGADEALLALAAHPHS